MSWIVTPRVVHRAERRLAREVDEVLVGVATELRHVRAEDPDVVCRSWCVLSQVAGSKANAIASVPSSSVPATNVVMRTGIPSFTCSGSGGMFDEVGLHRSAAVEVDERRHVRAPGRRARCGARS